MQRNFKLELFFFHSNTKLPICNAVVTTVFHLAIKFTLISKDLFCGGVCNINDVLHSCKYI